ncbi:thiazolylpeptide-type bacteriocin [Erythrobacter crassostreae]|uniref:Thiazolylpeptide-type bacteriocin n=1 Tax=Erythrobacter crassostreae TaxID=2828328 RepID=A0A9X1F532_9SPHN|nr:thiazolylpeptide-type bacteriocin [Erythrobacter crassostrea]MBV7260297.1 thiazolylpeptide-type bacteriocin [Erythrobacter crassostrea]
MKNAELDISFDLDDLGDLGDFEVVSLGDAMAMPETGASSGISSCNSSSCCLSTSTCQLT